uniref:Uncharacterized protein n=1 Tax=Arundo donax TaxID=35708 RepID=A0A0A9B783_ARUDO
MELIYKILFTILIR